ncbi:NADH-quinone oxidoreductase subunit B family protein [Desulfosarcina alkanivorans]|nr:NADH-quinone oxidoreductase subunit NuoB [Desulfosarcina alkanivorans]
MSIRWLDKLVRRARMRSPWMLHFDCGSCNGCDIEVLACLTPVYDVERFGIVNVGNPLHADLLVVSGTVNRRNGRVLANLYEQMAAPKVTVAVGTCGLSGGIFRTAYNVVGGIDRVIPVDVYVPGCPPRPEAIIDGVFRALKCLDRPSDDHG